MKHKFLICFTLFFNICLSQVGINNTNPNATLEITASNTTTPQNTDGLLIPRVSNFPATNPTAAQNSMLIYLTNNIGGNTPGFYFWNNNSTSWEKIGWSTKGNSGTDPTINFLGTLDNQDLTFRTNDTEHWRISTKGQLESLQNRGAIYIGENAGENDQSSSFLFDSNSSIFIGKNAGYNNTSGINNIAIGPMSLNSNVTGGANIAIGPNTLLFSTSDYNTAIGEAALRNLTTGEHNTSVGGLSGYSTSTGSYNTFLGQTAGMGNTTGNNNVYLGNDTARYSANSSNNVVIGQASFYNSNGSGNVIIGKGAGNRLENISSNVFIGPNAMTSTGTTNRTGSQNVAIGERAGYESGDVNGNILIGYRAGTGITESNRLYIENSSSTSPLIYGEFDNDIIRINGTFQIGDLSSTGYTFPATRGSNGQTLITDANGNLSWQNITGSSSSPFTKTGTTIRPTNVGDDLSFDSSDSSITFAATSTSAPSMINMFSSGSTNYERMVIAHSETSPNYGLKYTDIGDYFSIVGAGNEMIRLNTIGANPLTVNGTATFGNSGNQYTLPSTDGQKGNVLTTDGSGNVNWSGTMTKNITSTGFVFGNFTITDTIYTLKVLNTITSITIPDATTQTGRIIVLIGTNGITTKNFNITNGNVYDVVTNSNITSISANQRFTIQSDGTNWLVISN